MRVIKNSEGVQLIPETSVDDSFIKGLEMMGQCEVVDYTVGFGSSFRDEGMSVRSRICQTTGQREKDITPEEPNIENPNYRSNHKIGGGYSGLLPNGKDNR